MCPNVYHIPALYGESLDGLAIKPTGIYVDATFGGGGHSRGILERLEDSSLDHSRGILERLGNSGLDHSRGILERLGDSGLDHSRGILERRGNDGEDHRVGTAEKCSDCGRLFGFDRDIDALANVPESPLFTFVHSDFRYISNFLYYHGVEKVDGILADLGVSFHHFDSADRGFSFRSDAPLDMRMNQSGDITAADIVSDYDKESLERVFRSYTDLKRPGQIAAAIVKARGYTTKRRDDSTKRRDDSTKRRDDTTKEMQDSPIATTFQLVEAVKGAISPKSEKKDLAQIFQALRIEVNGEMKALQGLLEQSLKVLKPGGRLVVITYHSIEDRMVKNFMRSGNIEGKVERDIYGRVETPWKVITRSPIVPDAEEVERNPRSRSAKLRIAELL